MSEDQEEQPDHAGLEAWRKAWSEQKNPKPKINEMVELLERRIAFEIASAQVTVEGLGTGVYRPERVREIVVMDEAISLLKRIKNSAPEWPRHVQDIIRDVPPERKKR